MYSSKILGYSFIFLSITFSYSALSQECTRWDFQGKSSPIIAHSCHEDYKGTFKLFNSSEYDARIGYIIIFNDGRSERYSKSLEAGQTSQISCYSCNPNKGSRGVKGIEIYKHAYKGEDGYW